MLLHLSSPRLSSNVLFLSLLSFFTPISSVGVFLLHATVEAGNVDGAIVGVILVRQLFR